VKTLITIVCLSIPAASASTACVTGSYASYQALSGGCSIGDAMFSNFSALSFVNSPGVASLSSTEIQVTPGGTATDATLTFLYFNAGGTATAETLNAAGQLFSFGLTFDITVSPVVLDAIQMASTFANTGTGEVSSTKTAQLMGGGPEFTSTVSNNGAQDPMATYNGGLASVGGGAGTFVITDTTSLQAQGGTATQAGFENSFLMGPGTTAPTAEVGSLIMLGSGLIFLGLLGTSAGARKRVKG
jgi:hypothetical protein